uniref:Uncharacterized protein n=1 Tax=Panagrolaimus sp. ES5 TaxID=591445 RepID=A0AC34GCC6_9BILA
MKFLLFLFFSFVIASTVSESIINQKNDISLPKLENSSGDEKNKEWKKQRQQQESTNHDYNDDKDDETMRILRDTNNIANNVTEEENYDSTEMPKPKDVVKDNSKFDENVEEQANRLTLIHVGFSISLSALILFIFICACCVIGLLISYFTHRN